MTVTVISERQFRVKHNYFSSLNVAEMAGGSAFVMAGRD